MRRADQYDLVIVGAGPAGLMAAVTAARHSLTVAIVERKVNPADINRSCCTALINEPGTHEELVTLEKGKMVFHRTDFSVPYNGPAVPLERIIKYSPGGNTLTVARDEDPVAIAYNKECLLEGLVRLARETGVTILGATEVLKAENVEETVHVTARQKGDIFTIISKTAIAADGVNSRIVDKLGLNKGRKNFGTMQAVTYYMQDVDCPGPPSWIVFVGRGHTPSGMGQLYCLPKPQKDGSLLYEITLGEPAVGTNSVHDDLDWFLEHGIAASWFQKARIKKRLSAILKFYTPIAEPRSGGILIVGDAASYIEVYVQGALMYGYQAARSVISFVRTGRGLDDYVDFWKRTFGYNKPGAIEAATQAFGLHVLDDDDLDYIFKLTDGETFKGYVNEHSSRETTMGAILSHLDQIKTDRPALAVRIEKLDQHSTEEFLQTDRKAT